MNEAASITKGGLSKNPFDLYAGLYIENHGGVKQLITFKDFAGMLSQPKYLLDYCVVTDVDNNSSSEIYLTYFLESDRLDAKSYCLY